MHKCGHSSFLGGRIIAVTDAKGMIAISANGAVLGVSIVSGWFPNIVFGVGVVVAVILLLASFGRQVPRRRWGLRIGLAAAIGAVVGWVVGWLVSDIWNPFDVALSVGTRLWLMATGAGIGLAVVSLWGTRWWARVAAIVCIPAVVFVGAVGVNADVGEYPTLGAALNLTSIGPLHIPQRSGPAPLDAGRAWQSWKPPAGMPKTGELGSVTIPGTVSHFAAREAIVYLPPAALVESGPQLPVMIVMSGQPGAPSDIFIKGAFRKTLDAFAAGHNGIAPIVVVPDQLGSSTANPMCVDSPLGNSASYLTVDVVNWIKSNLDVDPDRTAWTIGGFSQGGTCAIQLGAADPGGFGSILDIAGQEAPRNGTRAHTIDVGFGGDSAKYDAALPLTILAKNAPYLDEYAVFVVGENDSRYRPVQDTVSHAATKSGMTVDALVIKGTSHDWHTAKIGLSQGLDLIGRRLGVGAG